MPSGLMVVYRAMSEDELTLVRLFVGVVSRQYCVPVMRMMILIFVVEK
jgi:hypothetical protein